jgi:glutamate-1-semialdehyde 2,1-aminomutase
MGGSAARQIDSFKQKLEREYELRFPGSRSHLERHAGHLLDGTSHAIRWSEPFMPVVSRANGAEIRDLDGHRIIDYWQGHFANILGHNPPLIRNALAETLSGGGGLQSGMLHEIEGELCELLCRATGSETVRLTTSGSLAVFYAVLLARAFTGRERVLKVAGGWHGSQPFGLKGVSARDESFEHLESEGLSASTGAEIILTRFNDIEDLRALFDQQGDRLSCFVLEPLLGAGGGMAVTAEYLKEARYLTERHGALLLCDEIITAFRFHAGDLCALYGVRPDLLILGKIIGGGMPVAAVAGRRELLQLCTRASGRVKFEGGTYSAHELSLVAARAMIDNLMEQGGDIYSMLAKSGERLRAGISRVAAEAGIPLFMYGKPDCPSGGSSLLFLHMAKGRHAAPTCPEELVERSHTLISERLLKSTLLLEDLSVRSGLGAISAAHSDDDLERTLDAYGAAFDRFKKAGLL